MTESKNVLFRHLRSSLIQEGKWIFVVVDYIPSVFGCTKRPESEGSVHQREERQKRVDTRRWVPEETEHDKGNYEDLGNLSDHQDNEV